jgi:hypothetical protein
MVSEQVCILICGYSFLQPPLDEHFAFGKETDRLFTLGMQYAKEGFLHTTEGEECYGRDYPDIYADIAAVNPVLELPSALAV